MLRASDVSKREKDREISDRYGIFYLLTIVFFWPRAYECYFLPFIYSQRYFIHHGTYLFLFEGGDDGRIKMWLADSGILVMTFVGHTSFISDMDLEREGRFLLSCAVDGSLRVWDLKKRGQSFAVQASCEFRGCMIRKRTGGFSLFATGSDSCLRLWRVVENSRESFQVDDFQEINFKRADESESFRVFDVSPDGRTFAVLLSSGQGWIFETDAIDLDSCRLNIQDSISDIKYCETLKQWIVASRNGSIYSAFFINHSCQVSLISKLSISSQIDAIDICGLAIGLYIVGSDFFCRSELPSLDTLKKIHIDGTVSEIIKNHTTESVLKSSSHVFFPLLNFNDISIPFVKISTEDFESTSATRSSMHDTFLIGDDAGRIHIVSCYSKSNYRFAMPRFFEFETDDIIFDEHGYSISVPRRMRFENIVPKRNIEINFDGLERAIRLFDDYPIKEEISVQTSRQISKTCTAPNSYENLWLVIDHNSDGFIPQLYDRVVLFLEHIEASKSISNILARHIDSQPIIQSLKRSKSIVFGTVTDIQIDIGSVDAVSISLKLDVSIVENFQNMEDDEIPMSKTHISLIYNPQFNALRNIICSLERYTQAITLEHRRGEMSMCFFDWNVIEPVIILGESRDTSIGNIKVRRVKSGMVSQVPLLDIIPSREDSNPKDIVFDTLCRSFSKKLKSVLKTAKCQKTLNLVDYLIEGKDEDHILSLAYPITISLVVKRLESSYYRRLDSIIYDLNRYCDNLDVVNDDLADQTRESVKNILTLIKTHFKPRIKR